MMTVRSASHLSALSVSSVSLWFDLLEMNQPRNIRARSMSMVEKWL